jgi:hypothetical protein
MEGKTKQQEAKVVAADLNRQGHAEKALEAIPDPQKSLLTFSSRRL